MSDIKSSANYSFTFRSVMPSLRAHGRLIAAALRRNCRITALLILGALLLLGFGAKELGYRAEDIQVLLFPFIVAVLVAIPRDTRFRLPLLFSLTALLLWALSVFHLRVVEPSRYENQVAVLVSRLRGDGNSVFTRQFQKRYQEVAGTYGLPAALLLERSFSSPADASEWLAEEAEHRLFLLRGSRGWFQAVFNPRLTVASMLAARSMFEGAPVHELVLPWTERPLLLGELPPSIQIPAEPREFSIHAIAWLSQALAMAGDADSKSRAAMRDALAQLVDTASVGLSDGVAGIGQHLQALSEMLEFQAQGYVGRERVEAAIEALRDAARFVKMKEEPELFSLIFNNAGVALFSIAETPEELYRAHFWLRVAHDAAQFGERRALGARLAMENLLRVEEEFSHGALLVEDK